MCSSRPTIVLHVYLTCCLLLGISKHFTRLSHTSRQKSWSAFYLPDISFVFFLSSCLNVIFSLSATDLLHPARRLVEWLRHRLGAFCESEYKMIRHLSSSQFHLLMFVFFFLHDYIYRGLQCTPTSMLRRQCSKPSHKFSTCQGFVERYLTFFSCSMLGNIRGYTVCKEKCKL